MSVPLSCLPAANTPIREIAEPPNWARLPIRECSEPLVVVGEADKLSVRAVYAEMNLPGASAELQVRVGVRDRLLQAASLLSEGVALCLFDGFRPLSLQRHLYNDYYDRIARENPSWAEAAIIKQVQQFVAHPNPRLDAPPPHRTGGAVDVFLVDTTTGDALAMGTDADEISSRSVTCWYESHPQAPFTENRRLLYHAMTAAGFSNYQGEWWHFEFGNQRWANCTGAPFAIYGVPREDQ